MSLKIKEVTEMDKTPPAFKSLEKETISMQKELDNVESKMKNLSTIKFNNDAKINTYKKMEASGNLSGHYITDYIDLKNDNKQITKDLEDAIGRYNLLISKVMEYDDKLSQAKKEYKEMTLSKLNSELEISKNKLEEAKDKAWHLKDEIHDSLNEKSILQYGDGFKELGKKIDKFKIKMSRLIGTAMIFNLMRNQLTNLRNNMISLLKTNSSFSNNLNQIKANLMTAFAPIYNACLPAINSLMNALSKLTGTIAKFVSSLFGKSLEDAKNEASGLSKALKKVKNGGKEASGSLASFDKLEVIGDNGASGSSSSDINYDNEITYSQKILDMLNAVKDFVVQNKELIIGFLYGLAAGIVAVKLGMDGIKALAFGTMLAGVVTLIQGIMQFIQDPSWDNFAVILQGLALILAGVAIAMLAVNAANPVAWIIAAIAAIVALGALIIKHWDETKAILGKVGDWIYEHIISPVINFFSSLWQGITYGCGVAVRWVKDKFKSMITFFSNLISKIVGLFKNIGTKVGNVIASAFKLVINGVLKSIENILNFPIKSINKLIDVINKVPGINIGTLPTFNLPRLAKGAVIPARHEFAAILGDQKHGTNIEAPLETIKQANREVMEEFIGVLSNLDNKEREIVFKNLTIITQLGTSSVKKVVLDSIRLSEKELGKQLLLA